MQTYNINHRKTQTEKNANDFEYYRTILDSVQDYSPNNLFDFNNQEGSSNPRSKMQVNYDLYNNKIDVNEFNYVCKPFGENDFGELPANMSNKDIISGKIKAVEAMEILEPFNYTVIAVNEEATTRKEEEMFGQIKQYVIDSIMMPIRMQIEEEMMTSVKNVEELTDQEKQQLQQQIEEEIKNRTPDKIYKYMQREYQDPAEMLAVHLLNYIQYKEDFKRKTNKGWKHACITAHEIYYVNHDSDLQPSLNVVNPLYINFDRSSDVDFIEDLDWFSVVYPLTTTQVIKLLGNELTDKEIDDLYAEATHSKFAFDGNVSQFETHYHEVLHATWVSLRKIGFLSFIDEEGLIQETLVSEDYKLDIAGGDVDIEWHWIPETHEGYKIGEIYKRMGPVLGQVVDMDNLYKHKLPYCGAIYDNMNSEPVSLVDRMKYYQYYYNIIMYRIEKLMASDKGKVLMMNIGAIPNSAGIDLDKFLYYIEALNIGFYDPNEEGNRGNADAGSIAKEIDMSLASNIMNYMNIAEYIERRCGESVGITKQIEGQTPHQEAVRNAQLNYQQASAILQTYYDLHSVVKKNLLTILLEKTKVLYALNPKQRKLQYILDDMTLSMFEVDFELLDNSSYGIFISNSVADRKAKDMVEQLSHAAMQNDKANLAMISKMIRTRSVQEAEELMEKSEREAQERAEKLEQMKGDIQMKIEQVKNEEQEKQREHEKTMIILKEEERRKTELQKAAMIAMSFNEDKDLDKDSVPDVLEIYKQGLDADVKIKNQKLKEKDQELKEKRFQHDVEKDAQQMHLMKKKLTSSQI